MRIIAGTFKGRALRGPTGDGVRPTSDRLRETLFNILRERADGAAVLDGFAGTGALGLEALSRGAARVTFVDRDPRALAVLRQNVAACRAENACVIIRDDFVGLTARHRDPGRFTLVLLDPPYDYRDLEAVLTEAARLLAEEGLVVLEHSRRRDAPARVDGLSRTRTVTAGDSALSFYTPAAGDQAPL
jgi:16S rRNA (guanine(966)-N(2))-methyltransferase RsmD